MLKRFLLLFSVITMFFSGMVHCAVNEKSVKVTVFKGKLSPGVQLTADSVVVAHDLHKVCVESIPNRGKKCAKKALGRWSFLEKVAAGTSVSGLAGYVAYLVGSATASKVVSYPMVAGGTAGLVSFVGALPVAAALTALTYSFVCSPTLPHKALGLFWKGSTGEAYDRLFRQYGWNRMADFCIAMRNSYVVNEPYLEQVLAVLNQNGFSQVYATNGGQRAIEHLKAMPGNVAVFDILQKGKAVNFVLPDGSLNESAVQKPAAQYYDELVQEFNPDGNKIVLFIDDTKENVEEFVRNRKNCIGVWYERTKKGQQHDTAQLVQSLKTLPWAQSPFNN